MVDLPPLTAEQRKFLKQHWGSEFQFLITYGLKISKDEDRVEGRQILKALMEDEAEEKEE